MTPMINNVNVDNLPINVQDAMITIFSQLSLKHKLVIYSRLIHGFLFKVDTNDIFNINKHTPSLMYNQFISELKSTVLKGNS